MQKYFSVIIATLQTHNNCKNWNTVPVVDTWYQLKIELRIVHMYVFKGYVNDIFKIK